MTYIARLRRVTTLARSFPTLYEAPGTDPFEPETFDGWAAEQPSHGRRLAAQFVLAVWGGGGHAEWAVGTFDLMEAMKSWDVAHREAFLAWARSPWWP